MTAQTYLRTGTRHVKGSRNISVVGTRCRSLAEAAAAHLAARTTAAGSRARVECADGAEESGC
ncbi:hypothetical protein [Streptomyces sp. NPDC002962]|uniref:hypothetical protein n=1 Tax=Streptomyces sp. NPDC002962 TaxID=3364674 RepID=UPI0036844BE2